VGPHDVATHLSELINPDSVDRPELIRVGGSFGRMKAGE